MLERTNVNLVIDGPPFTPRANRLKDGLKRTAFWPVISELTTDFKVHNTYLKPDVFTNSLEEYRSMRRVAGLWDVTGEEVVEITGPDARRLIERTVPRKLDPLKPGKSLFAFLLYPHGGVVEDGVLSMFDENRYWWVGGPGPAEVWLAANATGLDVAVRSYLDQIHLCAIQGPQSRDILRQVSDIDLDAMPWFTMREGRVCGVETVVTRTGFTAELGYDIHVDVGQALDVYQGLRAIGEPLGMVLCGSQAMNIRRMEAAILNIGAEIDWTTSPFELGWERMLDWSRDFVGREALEPLRQSGPSRRVAGLKLDGETVAKSGDRVMADGSEAGLISSAIWGPSVEASIALAMLVSPACEIGNRVTVETADGACQADVVALPFFDPERKLARA
ncbi:MAG: aminomethyltransferase family protein [Pseudomonadota bacterium]